MNILCSINLTININNLWSCTDDIIVL